MKRKEAVRILKNKLFWTIISVIITFLSLILTICSSPKTSPVALCAVYEKDYSDPVLKYIQFPDNADTIYIVSSLTIRKNIHRNQFCLIIPFPLGFVRTNNHYVDPIEYRIFNYKSSRSFDWPSFVPYEIHSFENIITKSISIKSKIEIIKDSLVIRNFSQVNSGLLCEPFTYDIEIIQNHFKNRILHVKNLVFASKGESDDDELNAADRFIRSHESYKWSNGKTIYCYYYDTEINDYSYHLDRDETNDNNVKFDVVTAKTIKRKSFFQLASSSLLKWVFFIAMSSIILYLLKTIMEVKKSKQNGKLSINISFQWKSVTEKHFILFVLSNLCLIIILVCLYLWLNPYNRIIDIISK